MLEAVIGDDHGMSLTQPGPGASTLVTAFDAARSELEADALRGAGGRAALERYSDRVDAMLRQLFAEVAPSDAQIAVLALGGYGRRHLCLQSDIDLLVLFGGRIGADEEQFLRRFLNPLWDLGVVVGHQVRELDDFNRLEADNPEFLLALLDARPVAGVRSLFDRFGVLFHTASAHASILRSLLELIGQRHAAFNDTLYQLEPDVKEAPGALRDLTATRTIAMLTDPLLLRRGPSGSLRSSRGFPAARAFYAAPGCRTQPECAQPRHAGANGGSAWLSGRRAASARRAADERLLPSCPHRQSLVVVGEKDRAHS